MYVNLPGEPFLCSEKCSRLHGALAAGAVDPWGHHLAGGGGHTPKIGQTIGLVDY